MPEKGWQRRFDDPIPRGRQLVTLKNAGQYIMALPKREQNLPEWQTAISCLVVAAEGRDFLMHARIGMLRALNHQSRARVRSNPERPALGPPEAGKGSMILRQQTREAKALLSHPGWA
jgi:hypothetical protein